MSVIPLSVWEKTVGGGDSPGTRGGRGRYCRRQRLGTGGLTELTDGVWGRFKTGLTFEPFCSGEVKLIDAVCHYSQCHVPLLSGYGHLFREAYFCTADESSSSLRENSLTRQHIKFFLLHGI